jgi:uncharacterized membrane protein
MASTTVTTPTTPTMMSLASRVASRARSCARASCSSSKTTPAAKKLPRRCRRDGVVAAAFIAPSDPVGVWTGVFACAAFGLWAERRPWGANAGGAPLVSSLAALALANAGVMPTSSATYDAINGFLLPLAVPMLLFTADVRRVLRGSAKLLPCFVVGAAGTTLGTLAAYAAVPMGALGAEGWKMASALMARHIGGAVNFVAVANALEMTPSIMAAGLAADNLMNALYFAGLFALAKGVMPREDEGEVQSDGSAIEDDGAAVEGEGEGEPFNVLNASYALAVAASVGYAAKLISSAFGLRGMDIPIITLITVVLATSLPKRLGALAGSGEALATLVMQAFFVAVGASGSITLMITTAPSLFFFSCLQVAVHLAFLLAVGKIFRFDRAFALVASNACVGGPTTAAAMASSKRWKSLIVPSMLVGVLGYTVATFLGIAFGRAVLVHM